MNRKPPTANPSMRLAHLDLSRLRFQTSAEADRALRAACAANPDVAACEIIGESEEGRAILGVTLGYGPAVVTLVAGAHADEPVGPETLRTLILETLAARDWGADAGGFASLFERVTLRIVPHVNPDAEARNRTWIERWDETDPAATLGAFLRERRREPPGRDIEFGFPAMRPENRAATVFLFDGSPVALHASLHGMAFSEGALVLVERRWLGSPAAARVAAGFLDAAQPLGLAPHDHDRGGDKGFAYGGPGVWTTPEGAAMRAHFRDASDDATAAQFHDSSMETAVARGSDGQRTPLCLVPELPLFAVTRAPGVRSRRGVAARLAAFTAALPEMQLAAEAGQSVAPWVDRFGVRLTPLAAAVRLHLTLLDLGLAAVDATAG